MRDEFSFTKNRLVMLSPSQAPCSRTSPWHCSGMPIRDCRPSRNGTIQTWSSISAIQSFQREIAALPGSSRKRRNGHHINGALTSGLQPAIHINGIAHCGMEPAVSQFGKPASAIQYFPFGIVRPPHRRACSYNVLSAALPSHPIGIASTNHR